MVKKLRASTVALVFALLVGATFGWRYFGAHVRAIDLCWGEAHADYTGCVSWARSSLFLAIATEDEIRFELETEEEPEAVREL